LTPTHLESLCAECRSDDDVASEFRLMIDLSVLCLGRTIRHNWTEHYRPG
jgi:hypothetical protein